MKFTHLSRRCFLLVATLLLPAISRVEAASGAPVQKMDEVVVSQPAPLILSPVRHHLQMARFAAAAVSDGLSIYVIGGLNSSGTALNEIERFDPATGKSEIFARLARPRAFHRAAIHHGKIYVLGGLSPSPGPQDFEFVTEIIDIASRKVSRGPSMPVAKANFACSITGDELYIIGGERISGSALVDTNSTEILNLSTLTWSKGIPMPTPRRTLSVNVTGFIFIPGGARIHAERDEVEVFIPQEKLWRTLPKLHTPFDTQAIAFLGHHVFMFGNEEFIAYDLRTKKSFAYPANYRLARYLTAVVHGGKIYTLGGSLNPKTAFRDTTARVSGSFFKTPAIDDDDPFGTDYLAQDDIQVFSVNPERLAEK